MSLAAILILIAVSVALVVGFLLGLLVSDISEAFQRAEEESAGEPWF